MKIILIAGKQGSGKTTLSSALVWMFEQAQIPAIRIRFASTIYEMETAVKRVAFANGIVCEEKEGTLLQLLGTEWGRKTKGEDVWVNALKVKMNNLHANLQLVFVIDDCRFKNEVNAFPNAFKIKLIADENARRVRTDGWRENTQHQSEIDLDDVGIDKFHLVVDTGIYSKNQTAAEVYELARNYFRKMHEPMVSA